MPEKEKTLWISHIAYPVTVLGPGHRVVLWTAGCSIGCEGCLTRELWNREDGKPMAVDVLATRLGALEGLDGLTVSGGEPLQQPKALTIILEAVRVAQPAWSVILYTGYRWEELESKPWVKAVLQSVDVLIEGRYEKNSLQVHPLAGSGNQNLRPLTERGVELLKKANLSTEQFNLGLGTGDRHWVIGIPGSSEPEG